MEGFLGLLGAFALIIGFNVVLHFIKVGFVAAGRTATKGGNFKENFDVSLNGSQALEMQIIDKTVGEGSKKIPIKEIQVKGIIPVTDKKRRLGFYVSVLDSTTKDKRDPVFSVLEDFQEKNTYAYQYFEEVGEVEPSLAFIKWVRAGIILPEILQPPFGGIRKLTVILRLLDLDQPNPIRAGFHSGEPPAMLAILAQHFEYNCEFKGYEEQKKERQEAQAIAIKIGVSVAMADGEIVDSEGEIIKNWIKKTIAKAPDSESAVLKEIYNEAFKTAFFESKEGNLSLSKLTGRLNEIGDLKVKYETIELCFDVMAADGKMEPEELKTIRDVSLALGLDQDEIAKIRDQKIIKMNSTSGSTGRVEDLLGIRSDWDEAKVKRHLRDEFQKWNNRITALPPGEERDNAQKMLDLIAEARKKCA